MVSRGHIDGNDEILQFVAFLRVSVDEFPDEAFVRLLLVFAFQVGDDVSQKLGIVLPKLLHLHHFLREFRLG